MGFYRSAANLEDPPSVGESDRYGHQPDPGAHRHYGSMGERFGWAGLRGALIQMGYYTGNAVSQTSGGRYLEPVLWVLLLYYCLGLFTLA